MEYKRIQHAIDLLGPSKPSRPSGNGAASQPARLRPPENGASCWQYAPANADLWPNLPAPPQPKLDIPWGDFHQGWARNFAALLTGPRAAKDFLQRSVFRDSWVELPVPARAVLAAALWHVAFLLAPISLLPGLEPKKSLFQNTEITWQGPIQDLPLLDIPKEQPKPKPKVDPPPVAPQLPELAEVFHPRQRIFTDPVRPTHPQQTLINPVAPAIAPKLLPKLPNMVLFQQARPERPKPQITEQMLKQLRPRERVAAANSAAVAPNLEQHVATMNNLPAMQNGPARPKLELNAGAAPRLAARSESADTGPAPDVAAGQLTASNGGATALIALSNAPAPPAPIAPPAANTAAKVSLGPDAKPGAPAGSANPPSSAAPGSSVGVSISGGNPPTSPDPASSGAAKVSAPAPRVLVTRPEPKQSTEEAERTAPPDFAALPPDAKPEVIFATRKVYTMNVNMPNMNSATGSWILNFSELHTTDRPRIASSDPLSGPVPVKKVDPKYPPDLKKERVEGEVILYAVIRSDGSVDRIQLVRGIDPQLDANSVSALRQWKFRPAEKAGAPVDLEAIVHIPFRLPEFP